MSLVSLRNLSFSWSGPPLLDGVDLEIQRGERIGVLGRNGAGKSTLMKIISGDVEPDDGEVRLAEGVRIGHLIQDVPAGEDQTVFNLVVSGLEDDQLPDWKQVQSVERVLSRMKLDKEAAFADLSSGMKRRALLARSLVREPELLLLDEPTNHLDIESITWLEGFLSRYSGSLLFITHDRVFLQALATRIIELDCGRLFDWTCDFATFRKRKDALLQAEDQQRAHFDRKLAEEERWIRRGIKARRTRNEGRVRALEKMRRERQERRERVGTARMQAVEAEKSGRLVIAVQDLTFEYPDKPIVRDFSTRITRGDRIGIIGPNGAGKSTLLRLLLGELPPTAGTVRHGTRLQVIYFDQLREQLDEARSVLENVSEGEEILDLNGRRQHVYGYLQDFLFTPERARQPVKSLSGGERNRLLFARLFKRSSNVMVLDEPTNDLDAETLELLEELVADYGGTLLLVSHDRAFLNNVVTSTIVLKGDGTVKEYDGGYDDYVRQRDASEPRDEALEKANSPGSPRHAATTSSRPQKLSYREQQELDSLPLHIEELEAEQERIHAAMTTADYFKQDPMHLSDDAARLATISNKLENLYQRWEALADRE